MTNRNQDQFALRSIVIQEILGYIPHWMLRWGSTLIAVLFTILLFITWLIQYPDILEGKGCLTTTTPPITLYSLQQGTIGRIYVQDNAMVEADTPLAEINNALSETTVMHVKNWIFVVEKELANKHFKSENYPTVNQLYSGTLGAAQEAYNSLHKHVQQYINSFQNDHHLFNCQHIRKQMADTHTLLHITQKQLTYAKRKVAQEQVKFRACEQLYQRKSISQVDFFTQESLLLSAEEMVANKEKCIVEYQIALHNYEEKLEALFFTYQHDKALVESDIYADLQNLKKAIAGWQQNHLLRAPFTGQVCYIARWHAGQQVKAEQELFSIIPANGSYNIQLQLPSAGYGKIAKGQPARIKLAAYPTQEYGYLRGKVEEVALIPHQATYRVTLLLTNGLTTNYGKQVVCKPNMECSAEIVTNQICLLKRLFYPTFCT